MDQLYDAIFKWVFSESGIRTILFTLGIVVLAVVIKILINKFVRKVDDVVDEHLVKKDVCPKCGGKLVKRHGKYGDFIGCSNYPKCRYTHDKMNEKDEKAE